VIPLVGSHTPGAPAGSPWHGRHRQRLLHTVRCVQLHQPRPRGNAAQLATSRVPAGNGSPKDRVRGVGAARFGWSVAPLKCSTITLSARSRTGIPALRNTPPLKCAYDAAGSAASAKWDCRQPCEMNVAPVCTTDGFTLQNDCLAVCQGLKVAQAGQCKGSTVAFSQPAPAGPAGKPSDNAHHQNQMTPTHQAMSAQIGPANASHAATCMYGMRPSPEPALSSPACLQRRHDYQAAAAERRLRHLPFQVPCVQARATWRQHHQWACQ
jgi:hypothetical protein